MMLGLARVILHEAMLID